MAFVATLLFGCGGDSGPSATAGGSTAEGASGGEANAPGSSPATPEDPSEPTEYPKHAGFTATPITAGQRSQLARSGQIELPVQVAAAGTASAFGQAEIGGSIVRAATAAPQTASGAGTVDLTVRLTSPARKALAGGGSFLMYLAVRYSGSRTAQQFTVPLGPQG